MNEKERQHIERGTPQSRWTTALGVILIAVALLAGLVFASVVL